MRTPKTIFTIVTLVLSSPGLAAQEPPAGTSGDTPTLQELHQALSAQQELLQKQERELERQSELITQQRDDLEVQRRALRTMQTQLDQLGSRSAVGTESARQQIETREALAEGDRHQEAEPETPMAVLLSGDFPGSIHLPGTNLNARVGGFVRLGAVNSLDPIGSDDRFIVGSIPARGQATAGDEPRSTISAKRSRVNLDVRMDSSVGQFRAFVEGDFAGDGGTENYRLRHAFGQYNRLLLGQTWSTFMDTRAIPEGLDFEGVSGQINVRHPMIRWAGLDLIGQNWAFALEDPEASLSGGNGVGEIWDGVLSTSWNRPRRHLQLGIIGRSLSGKPTLPDGTEGEEDTAYGYGLSVTGRHTLRRQDGRDNFKWQLNFGEGIGNYINDLRSIGGQDGVFDPETGKLEQLPVLASYVSYQRHWRPINSKFFRALRSTLVYSYIYIDNFDFQESGAYKATQRVSANVMFSPISSLDIGAELLWGTRRNTDSSEGEAFQLQLVATFRF